MTYACVIPMRSFRTGKTRLADSLGPEQRAVLARRWFETSLQSVASAQRICVLTSDDEVHALSVSRGYEVLKDPLQPLPLASLVDRAIAHIRSSSDVPVLIVMADLPQIVASEVESFCASAASVAVAAAPSTGGTGTNALWMNRGVAIRTAFGATDSLARHGRRTLAAGLTWSQIPLASAALDIDTSDDLQAWLRQGGAL